MMAADVTAPSEDLLRQFRDRVAEDLRILAALHDREPDSTLASELRAIDFPRSLTLPLANGPAREAVFIMEQSLKQLLPEPDSGIIDELAADYASIYLNYGIGASPEESVWIDEDNLICQNSMFQVRQWYESFGLSVPDWRTRPDDHLVYQLQFIAHMLERGEGTDTEVLRQVATFMDEHLLRWVGSFAQRVMQRCDTPWFAGAASLTAAYAEELRDILCEILQQPRPTPEEIEERMQPRKQAEEVPVTFMPGMGPVV